MEGQEAEGTCAEGERERIFRNQNEIFAFLSAKSCSKFRILYNFFPALSNPSFVFVASFAIFCRILQ